MLNKNSSEDRSMGWQMLQQTPWGAVLLVSSGVAAWLLLMQVQAMSYLPQLPPGAWLGVGFLAWGAGLWLVLLPVWALVLAAQMLDGPTVTAPWRGTVLAVAGLGLSALVLWVGVWGLAPIYAAFGVFVLVVLLGVRASLVRVSQKHGLFVFMHDTLELLMWALWGSLPYVLWLAAGQAMALQTLQALACGPLALGLAVVAVAHVPAVLQPRLRLLLSLLVVLLGLAWLSRPVVIEPWAQGMLGLVGASAQEDGQGTAKQQTRLVVTDVGCAAINAAMAEHSERKVCWYDPLTRQGTVQAAGLLVHQGPVAVLEFASPTSTQQVLFNRSELIAWARSSASAKR